MGDFTMPSLGADMSTGTVSHWLVKPGDAVHRGDVVAVVETDKSTVEVEIFENGTVEQLLIPEGERVPVGTVLAHVSPKAPKIARPSRSPVLPSSPSVTEPLQKVQAQAAATGPSTIESHALATPHGPVISPIVRHLAERLGIDPTMIPGSGPGGVVTRSDVEQAARKTHAEAPRQKRSTRRRQIETVAAPSPRPAARTASSPLARRLATELGVDISALHGSGPAGSVIERDVRFASATPAAKTAVGEPADLGQQDRSAAMRRAIGALMARSKREIPHYYLSTTIDMSRALSWLEQKNLDRPVTERLVASVLLFKATAAAITRVPEMNGFYVNDAFEQHKAVHLGVAISLRAGGVIAPAIHDAEMLSLDELMTALKDLVERTRKGVLRSSEMSTPTITVTNLGDLGAESVFGVIYPPQVALVGFGRLRDEPWVENGMIGVRPCVTATLSGDHRVSDGLRGGRFLAEINRLLQEPDRL